MFLAKELHISGYTSRRICRASSSSSYHIDTYSQIGLRGEYVAF